MYDYVIIIVVCLSCVESEVLNQNMLQLNFINQSLSAEQNC